MHTKLVCEEYNLWIEQTVACSFFQNRPLGAIEREHQFMSPQPVLSCRTVDIDTSGTRIYQAKSADKVLDEQHRLIHEIYSQARFVMHLCNARRVRCTVEDVLKSVFYNFFPKLQFGILSLFIISLLNFVSVFWWWGWAQEGFDAIYRFIICWLKIFQLLVYLFGMADIQFLFVSIWHADIQFLFLSTDIVLK